MANHYHNLDRRGESGAPVVKKNLVAVDPISGLLVLKRVLATSEGKYGIEIRRGGPVA